MVGYLLAGLPDSKILLGQATLSGGIELLSEYHFLFHLAMITKRYEKMR